MAGCWWEGEDGSRGASYSQRVLFRGQASEARDAKAGRQFITGFIMRAVLA